MSERHKPSQTVRGGDDIDRPELLFDADGFLRNPTAWDREVGATLAARAGIAPLSDAHWRVLETLRKHYFETGGVPVMRHICRDAGLEAHCVSELLDDPKRAWRIAGLPNPGEEAKVYLQTADLSDHGVWDTGSDKQRH